jgi:hypothetical protein
MATEDSQGREDVLNVLLAELLERRGLWSMPDGLRRRTDRDRPPLPGVTLVDLEGVRVVVEGALHDGERVRQRLLERARRRVGEGLSPLCLAVLYPPGLRAAATFAARRQALTAATLEIRVVSESDDGAWHQTTVPGVVELVRGGYERLIREDGVTHVVAELRAAIGRAARVIADGRGMTERLAGTLWMSPGARAESRGRRMRSDPWRVARAAAVTIVNAMLVQQLRSGHDRRVPGVSTVIDGGPAAERLAEVWAAIEPHRGAVPIVGLARQLVVRAADTPSFDGALRDLAEGARRLARRPGALRHDLMGRLVHRLLDDAKYFGAFYTTPPAAALLLKLALDPSAARIDWHDPDALGQLRIADLACGTGTLLKAALHTVVDNHVRAAVDRGACPDLDAVQRALVESVLWGLDVSPFAIHLGAIGLALHDPEFRFNATNLTAVPLGAPRSLRSPGSGAPSPVRLGSLELFRDRRIRLEADGSGIAAAATRSTAAAATCRELELPPLDLCVMNPPFTRSVGGNLLFGHTPAGERAGLQRALRELLARYHVEASVTAGLGSIFTALGDRVLKPGGHLALVLPRAVLSGVAWAPTRALLVRQYHVRTIVVSHEPGRWNFSENTDLGECLLVARRLTPGEPPGPTKVINLWRRPRTSIEALAVADRLAKAPGASLDAAGIDEAIVRGEKIAEVIVLEAGRIAAGRFHEGSAFAQTDLCRIARGLSDGRLYLPGRGFVAGIPVVPLGDLVRIGPDVRDVHDGFRLSCRPTRYPALWGHRTDGMRCIAQGVSGHLAPLSRARRGRPLRPARLLWPRAGRLMLAERLRLNLARVVCVHLPRPALSNSWWPLNVDGPTAGAQRARERVLALWLNSTLGLIALIAARVDTEGPWIKLKKPSVAGLPVLDPARLTAHQRTRLARLYAQVRRRELGTIAQTGDDAVRAQIDEGLGQALGVGAGLAPVRALLAREPVLRPAPAGSRAGARAAGDGHEPLRRPRNRNLTWTTSPTGFSTDW